jgi:hypothetical protein
MITKSIENCLRHARERGWTKLYWAIDIHSTILRPTYKFGVISTEFYPHAREVMQMISTRKDIVRILYTCSFPAEIEMYMEFFRNNDIFFDYINCNPEVPDGGYGYYKEKFYFNVLLDDKAGFDALTDWIDVKEVLEREFF